MFALQAGFGFIISAIVYAFSPSLRGMVMLLTPLGLLFGAFTLTPLQCRMLGAAAIVFQGCALAISYWSGLDATIATVDVILFLASAFVYIMVAEMAGQLRTMRVQLRVQKRALARAACTARSRSSLCVYF